METTQVIPSVSIEAVLARRERARALAQKIEDAHAELAEMARTEAIDVPSLMFNSHGLHRQNVVAAQFMKVVDASLWEWMLQRSGLWTFMDAKARAQWSKQKNEFEFPPLTEDNVDQTFRHIHETRGDMMSRGVDELFRRLSRSHKTNTGMGFTSKVIVEYLCQVWGTGSHRSLSVGQNSTNELDDLNRILHVLRGLPEPEHQQTSGYGRIRDAIDKSAGGPMIAEFPFFTVQVFKKGTGHIKFKHDTDVKRLNKVLAIEHGGLRIATPRHPK